MFNIIANIKKCKKGGGWVSIHFTPNRLGKIGKNGQKGETE